MRSAAAVVLFGGVVVALAALVYFVGPGGQEEPEGEPEPQVQATGPEAAGGPQELSRPQVARSGGETAGQDPDQPDPGPRDEGSDATESGGPADSGRGDPAQAGSGDESGDESADGPPTAPTGQAGEAESGSTAPEVDPDSQAALAPELKALAVEYVGRVYGYPGADPGRYRRDVEALVIPESYMDSPGASEFKKRFNRLESGESPPQAAAYAEARSLGEGDGTEVRLEVRFRVGERYSEENFGELAGETKTNVQTITVTEFNGQYLVSSASGVREV